MAVDDINANENIIPRYNISIDIIDSKCDPGVAVFRMTEMLHTGPQYVMVLGDGCSVVSEATAQVSHLYNVTQLSYGSSSPILSDRKRYPRFFRITTPDQKLNEARLEIMKTFGWVKVATIHHAQEFFSAVTDDFVKKAALYNVSIVSQEIFVHHPTARVENIKAYKSGLYGPKIVWVFVGWFSETFWLLPQDDVPCTPEEMTAAAEGAFLTAATYYNPVEERGIAGITDFIKTVSEFFERYYSDPGYDQKYDIYRFMVGQVYDHLWLAALTLNCTINELKRRGIPMITAW
ncbi:gamma-aminobutyric acid type B receptor subunit 1-like [Mya arenaria]|uniref:gamma-aminobutyric acid type B receptor subunit 1-like n=1 Tax=Mya arenaria TaxID=6604 RepID=UPI0022E0A189|nr:gamma-aminobutyric acid type B receptor subunit 1-like [Mya arenaria]